MTLYALTTFAHRAARAGTLSKATGEKLSGVTIGIQLPYTHRPYFDDVAKKLQSEFARSTKNGIDVVFLMLASCFRALCAWLVRGTDHTLQAMARANRRSQASGVYFCANLSFG